MSVGSPLEACIQVSSQARLLGPHNAEPTGDREMDVQKVDDVNKDHIEKSHIEKLPPELLCHIMEYYIYDAILHPTSHATPLPNPFTWLRITHICQHWRNVALQSPIFWSNISLNHVNVAEEFVQRTGANFKSLSVQWLRLRRTDDGRRLAVIALAAERIRSLSLMIPTGVLERLGREFGQRMSTLKELTLHRIFDGSGEDEIGLLGNFKSEKLEKLELHHFRYCSFDPLLGHTITNLYLDNGNLPLSPAEMLAALKKTPNLRRLTLDTALTSMGSAGTVQTPTVALPYLEELTLTINAPVDAMLLDSMDVPRLQYAVLQIHCVAREDSMPAIMESVAPLVNSVTKRMSGLAARFDGSDPDVMNIMFSEQVDGDRISSGRRALVEFWHFEQSPGTALKYTKDYLAVSLKVVRELMIADGPYPLEAVPMWSSVFRIMKDVEYVRLHKDAIHTIPNGFSTCEPDGTYKAIFPRLLSVVLDAVNFQSRQHDRVTTFIDDLLRSFESLAGANRIKSLTIKNGTGIGQEDITILRNFVRDVNWDHERVTGVEGSPQEQSDVEAEEAKK